MHKAHKKAQKSMSGHTTFVTPEKAVGILKKHPITNVQLIPLDEEALSKLTSPWNDDQETAVHLMFEASEQLYVVSVCGVHATVFEESQAAELFNAITLVAGNNTVLVRAEALPERTSEPYPPTLQ